MALTVVVGRACGRTAGPRYRARAMATDEQPQPGPRPCPPCRGTGRVISGAGGAPHEVTCPWCEGSGVFLPEHDAQAARRQGASA